MGETVASSIVAKRYFVIPFFIFFVAFLHAIGYAYGWYYIPLFSMLLHALGGFSAGGVGYAYAERIGAFPIPGKHAAIASFIAVLSFTALVGVLWELFEFMLGAIAPQGVYVAGVDPFSDTISDLTMDLFGGIAAFLLFRRLSENR